MLISVRITYRHSDSPFDRVTSRRSVIGAELLARSPVVNDLLRMWMSEPAMVVRRMSREQLFLFAVAIAVGGAALATTFKVSDAVGALLAGYGGAALGLYGPGQPVGWIASVIGAIIVLWIYGMVTKKG